MTELLNEINALKAHILTPQIAAQLASKLFLLSTKLNEQKRLHDTAYTMTQRLIYASISQNPSDFALKPKKELLNELEKSQFFASYKEAIKGKETEAINIFLSTAASSLESNVFSSLAATILAFGIAKSIGADASAEQVLLAYCEDYLGNENEARALLSFDISSEISAFFITLYFRLGCELAIKENQSQKAKTLAKTLLNIEQNAQNYLLMAKVFLASNNFKGADNEIQKANSLIKKDDKILHSKLKEILALSYLKQAQKLQMGGGSRSSKTNKIAEQKSTNELKTKLILAKNEALSALELNTKARLALSVLRQILAITKPDIKLVIKVVNHILALHPFNEHSWQNLCEIALKEEQSDLEELASSALSFYPNCARVYYIYGLYLSKNNKAEKAIAAYKKSIELDENNAKALGELADMCMDVQLGRDAEIYLNKALKIEPENLDLLCKKAELYIKGGKAEHAKPLIEKMAKLKANSELAVLSFYYEKTGDYKNALKSAKAAIKINPDDANLYQLGANAALALNDFSEYEKLDGTAMKLKPNDEAIISKFLFNSHYIYGKSEKEMFKLALKFGQIVESKTPYVYDSWLVEKKPKKLKIGFVSADLRAHPVGYFLASVLPLIDKDRYELYAFSPVVLPKNDAITNTLKAHFTEWVEIYAKSPETQASMIRQRGINVLFDLSGHIANHCLRAFAYKPAPVCASWIGYWASTGLGAMDYVIGDPIVSPPSEAEVMCERIYNLPKCFYHFSLEEGREVAPLPCLEGGGFTFGSFNNLYKMNDKVVAMWARILKAVPGSRLFLKYRQLDDEGGKERFIAWFGRYGIGRQRLILEGNSPRDELLASYARVDLALDPYPYHGTTTSAEAIMMGVPVLTIRGDSYLTRIGETTMEGSGLGEFIAASEEEYFAKAVFYASDEGRARLAGLRANMREYIKDKPVFDTASFVRDVEQMFEDLWAGYEDKLE